VLKKNWVKKSGCPKVHFLIQSESRNYALRAGKYGLTEFTREPVEVLHEISSDFLLFEQSLFLI